MTTVQEARRELEQLKYLGKSSSLSIRQSQPFNSFRDHYLVSIANMKRKRTYDSENLLNHAKDNGLINTLSTGGKSNSELKAEGN